MGVQKTALYDLHKSLGAKFVPFAGYEKPRNKKRIPKDPNKCKGC